MANDEDCADCVLRHELDRMPNIRSRRKCDKRLAADNIGDNAER
jgi:hypothetical protein